MSSAELLDAFDEWGAPLGPTPRAEVHRLGLWHHCLHLWVVHDGEVLLQRRAYAKGAFPGMLDATAAGHLLAGEAVLDGLREAEEELGVPYGLADVTALGVRRIVDRPTPATVNREHQHLFATVDGRPLEAFVPDPVEVAGVVALALADFQHLACDPADPGPWPGREWDGRTLGEVLVDRAEVVPQEYLPALSVALERLLAGRWPAVV